MLISEAPCRWSIQSPARVASRLAVLVIAVLLEALLEINLDAVSDK